MIRIHTYGVLESCCLNGEELRDTIKILVGKLIDMHIARHRLILQWTEFDHLELSWRIDSSPKGSWIKKPEASAGPFLQSRQQMVFRFVDR